MHCIVAWLSLEWAFGIKMAEITFLSYTKYLNSVTTGSGILRAGVQKSNALSGAKLMHLVDGAACGKGSPTFQVAW